MKIENSAQNLAQIGSFFRQHRLDRDLALEIVTIELGLPSIEHLEAFESGRQPLSLDDIFVLTNLYNISPDEVVRLFYDVSLGIQSGMAASNLKLDSGS